MEKVRVKLPEIFWWDNGASKQRRALIGCIYEQQGMLGLIRLNNKSITCNIEEKELVKSGIKEAIKVLKK